MNKLLAGSRSPISGCSESKQAEFDKMPFSLPVLGQNQTFVLVQVLFILTDMNPQFESQIHFFLLFYE